MRTRSVTIASIAGGALLGCAGAVSADPSVTLGFASTDASAGATSMQTSAESLDLLGEYEYDVEITNITWNGETKIGVLLPLTWDLTEPAYLPETLSAPLSGSGTANSHPATIFNETYIGGGYEVNVLVEILADGKLKATVTNGSPYGLATDFGTAVLPAITGVRVDGSATVRAVPAPGAISLLAAGGLIAARRRR